VAGGGVVRSSLVQSFKGGLSGVFLKLLEQFWGGPFDFKKSGCSVNVGNVSLLIFAHFKCLIADESALKSMIGFKGANGNKPCGLCKNVVSGSSELARHSRDYLVDVSCTIFHMFDLHTDQSIWESADMLSNNVGVLNKGESKTLAIALGMNYIPNGLMEHAYARHISPSFSYHVRLDARMSD
jgi:hypothetical protein